MNLNFYEVDALEKELEGLPLLYRIAFAASCCQRLLPNYNAFSRQENWGDPSVLRIALDEVWQILQGKPVDAALIRRLIEDCSDVIPDSDEFTSPNLIYDVEAQEAAIAICNTLEACLDPFLDLYPVWQDQEYLSHTINMLNFHQALPQIFHQ